MVDRGLISTQEIQFLDETITISAKVESRNLSPGFVPDNWSVVCGRGKQSYGHIGNMRLKVLVESNLPKYTAAKTKIEKTLIVTHIVETVRDASQTGGFVKLDNKTGQYYEVGDAVAREKVGQLLREAMAKRDPKTQQERRKRRKANALKAKLARRSSDESASTMTRPTATTDPASRLSIVSHETRESSGQATAPLPQPQDDDNQVYLAELEGLGRHQAQAKFNDKFEPLPYYYDDSSISGSSSGSSSVGMEWLSEMANIKQAFC